jgi:regulator of PEP synthase PpsR (kinase-PPPase family)
LYRVFVVSDGTGGTAERALRAALTQFKGTEVKLELRPEVRSEERILEIVYETVHAGGFIVHTLVSRNLRDSMGRLGRLYNVVTIDLMGPLLAQLGETFADRPLETPGLFRELNKEYFRRIEAMEFAFRHDDGQHTDELDKADIVLVGVSRTFKTPISMYLAFKGWLVGNVPIILDIPIPRALADLPAGRVFGLMTSAHQLTDLRRSRQEHLGGATGEYAEFQYVCRELAWARDVFRRRPEWSIIQVANKPIEEIAAEVLATLRRHEPLLRGGDYV